MKKAKSIRSKEIEKGVEKGIERGITTTIKKYAGKRQECKDHKCRSDTCGGCAYLLGFFGAAIYYISTATGFWHGVLGILKAMVWPLFLVLGLLQFIGG